jgi:non-specific serine/threonine protein kinase
VAKYRGQPAVARAYEEQARQIKRALGNTLGEVITLVELGKQDLVSGDAAGAGVHGQETLTLARAEKFVWGEAGALLVLGRAALAQDRFSRAQRLLDSALTLYRQLGHPQGVGYTLMALGVLALDTGKPSRARDFFIEALSLAQRAGEALLIARLIEELGGLSVGRQALRAAILAGAAAAQRQMLGASASDPELSPKDRSRIEGWLQDTRRELGEAGFQAAWRAGQALPVEEAIREAASAQAGDVDAAPVRKHLSPREQEVAALVAQGYTNQQIAARLVFAEATAKKHVEHILAKLEFKSRAQIVAWHLAGAVEEISAS